MTVSNGAVASLVASGLEGAENKWILCVNFLVEAGGALNLGGRCTGSKYNVRGGVLETSGNVQVADLDEDQSHDVPSRARWQPRSSRARCRGCR